ncbi:MAG: hypothetical protein IKL59_07885 [Clostridia bacterium]|nr:hypothetical protein [Clostridia bacterium]
MKKRLAKRVISLLITLVLAIGMIPVASIPAIATNVQTTPLAYSTAEDGGLLYTVNFASDSFVHVSDGAGAQKFEKSIASGATVEETKRLQIAYGETTAVDHRYIGYIDDYSLIGNTYTVDLDFSKNTSRAKIYFGYGIFGFDTITSEYALAFEVKENSFIWRRQSNTVSGAPAVINGYPYLNGGLGQFRIVLSGSSTATNGKYTVSFKIFAKNASGDYILHADSSYKVSAEYAKIILGIGEYTALTSGQYYAMSNVNIYKGDKSNFHNVYDDASFGDTVWVLDPSGLSDASRNNINGYAWEQRTLAGGATVSGDVITVTAPSTTTAACSHGFYTPHPIGSYWDYGKYTMEFTLNSDKRTLIHVLNLGTSATERVGFGFGANTAGNTSSTGKDFGRGGNFVGATDTYILGTGAQLYTYNTSVIRAVSSDEANVKIEFNCEDNIITMFEKQASSGAWVKVAAIDYSGVTNTITPIFSAHAWDLGSNIKISGVKYVKGLSISEPYNGFETRYDAADGNEVLYTVDFSGVSNANINGMNNFAWVQKDCGASASNGVLTVNTADPADSSSGVRQGIYTPIAFGEEWDYGYYTLELAVNSAKRTAIHVFDTDNSSATRIGFGLGGNDGTYTPAADKTYTLSGSDFGKEGTFFNAGQTTNSVYNTLTSLGIVFESYASGTVRKNTSTTGEANVKIEFNGVEKVLTLYELNTDSEWVKVSSINYFAVHAGSTAIFSVHAWDYDANVRITNARYVKGLTVSAPYYDFANKYDAASDGDVLYTLDFAAVSDASLNGFNNYNWVQKNSGASSSNGTLTVNTAAVAGSSGAKQGVSTPMAFADEWDHGTYTLQLAYNSSKRSALQVFETDMSNSTRIGFGLGGNDGAFTPEPGKAYLLVGSDFGREGTFFNAGQKGNTVHDNLVTLGFVFTSYAPDTVRKNTSATGEANVKIEFDGNSKTVTLFELNTSNEWIKVASIGYGALADQTSAIFSVHAWDYDANVNIKNASYVKGAVTDDIEPTPDDETVTDTDIDLVEDDFTIVVPASLSSTLLNSASGLESALESKLGISLSIKDETYYRYSNAESLEGAKIVVGALSDAISTELERPLRDNEYVIKVTDGSLYIIGGADAGVVQGVNYFLSNYINKDTPTTVFTSGVLHANETAAPVSELTVSGNDISQYNIVYYDSAYAKQSAQRIQAAIASVTGYTLPVISDSAAETEYEILVGKTNRDESVALRSNYARPNVYYDIKISGEKLVVMAEGYVTLDVVSDAFESYMAGIASAATTAISSNIASGDIIDSVDTENISMVNRAAGTDLRVFHWNMAAPYLNSANIVYTDHVTRGEVMADIILQLYPDIITTNELYKSHNGNFTFFNTIMGELGEYYTCLESPYDVGKPKEGTDQLHERTINENIIYRNDIGLSVVTSAWRYSTEKTDATPANPEGWVYYHGSHTAVFRMADGQMFILSVGHYADSRSSTQWAQEHLAAVADAQWASGSATPLPVILTGDMYTGYTSSSANSGYKYLVAQGYIDSQRTATVNANQNISHGTFHDIGVRQTTRISEDFVWHTDDITALCFKVLTSQDIDDTSDHYPVMADLKFN